MPIDDVDGNELVSVIVEGIRELDDDVKEIVFMALISGLQAQAWEGESDIMGLDDVLDFVIESTEVVAD